MKPQRFRVNQILDTLHRGAVWSCVGLTFYGFYLGGLRVHRYYTVVKPAFLEKKRLQELELLEEGKDKQDDQFLPEPPSSNQQQ